MILQNLVIKLNVYNVTVAVYMWDPPSPPTIASCFIDDKYLLSKYIFIKLPSKETQKVIIPLSVQTYTWIQEAICPSITSLKKSFSE